MLLWTRKERFQRRRRLPWIFCKRQHIACSGDSRNVVMFSSVKAIDQTNYPRSSTPSSSSRSTPSSRLLEQSRQPVPLCSSPGR